jgi:anti-anti-sigma factor
VKFSHRIDGNTTRVGLAGELDGASCNCLQAFWTCHLDERAPRVEIDMTEVDGIDGESIAVLVGIIRGHVEAGSEVVVRAAPQMLAHTLYKAGLLKQPGLRLESPRADEQPYA